MFKKSKTRSKNTKDSYEEKTIVKVEWAERLKRLTRQASKDNMDDRYQNNNGNDPLDDYQGSPSATDYQEMKDPLRSDPKLHRQPSATQIGPEEEEELEIYLVAQSHGYCSILFSIAQTIILIIMMVECGLAPLNINPMVGPYPGMYSMCNERRRLLFHSGCQAPTPTGLPEGVGDVVLLCL
jgi:hypothetical protein